MQRSQGRFLAQKQSLPCQKKKTTKKTYLLAADGASGKANSMEMFGGFLSDWSLG